MAAEHAPAFIHAQVWLIMAKEGGRWTPAADCKVPRGVTVRDMVGVVEDAS